MTFIFKIRTIFWDISKWNREPKKWDGGSIILKGPVTQMSLKHLLICNVGIEFEHCSYEISEFKPNRLDTINL